MSEPPREAGGAQGNTCLQCQAKTSQIGKFWVCPEHGVVTLSSPDTASGPTKDPRSVFISYGWEDATTFARRLAQDLKTSGSVVFFDRESIQKGSNFDVRIEHGIHDAIVFAAVLTPYSVRDDSICRHCCPKQDRVVMSAVEAEGFGG